MRFVVASEEMTVQGYREDVARSLNMSPHKQVMERLRVEYPKLRDTQLVVGYLLSYGEPLELVTRCYNCTPFLFRQWLTIPEFNGLITELAPQHTGSIEGFEFNTIEQQIIMATEMAKRLWMTIEERGMSFEQVLGASDGSAEEKVDPSARHGVLAKKVRMSNGKVVGTEYVGDEATSRELRNWLTHIAKLKGLLTDVVAGDTNETQVIRFEDIMSDVSDRGSERKAN